jgi:acetylornithine deacetylase/succinyl-diaminopimelate desuccinylase-like protein
MSPELQDEATELLQRLIRFDTVNPPGNERECLEVLAEYAAEAGFVVELTGAKEHRPNLIARLEGSQEGPVLGYLGHVDTVLADPDRWSRSPWSGDLADGCVWGRGALDMKSQVAAEAAAAVSLAREGWRPARGELKLLFVADEETGGRWGAQWLCRERPDLARCDYLLNEGGGSVVPYAGKRYYGVCTAEKGVFRFSVFTEGSPGHASMPRLGDNALLKMAPLLERLGEREAEVDLTDEPAAFLAAIGEKIDGDPAGALERLADEDPRLALIVDAMLRVTLAPTRISASEKINVIPGKAELQVDCRVPPGLGEADARRRIAEVLGEDGYRLEFHEQVVGNRSSAESDLMDFISRWVGEQDPGAVAVPTMLPAFTDSRHFRDAFPDLVAYGFFPMKHTSFYTQWPLIHGDDERIDVRDLGFATRFYRDLAQELLG